MIKSAEWVLRGLHATGREVVPQVELLTKVAKKRKGCTCKTCLERVRGTILGKQEGRLNHPEHPVQKTWAFSRHVKGGRSGFVRRNCLAKYGVEEYKVDYNTSAKQVARTRGLQPFLNLDLANPRVLTLGAAEGYCCWEMLNANDKTEIVSLENKEAVRKKFERNFKDFPNVQSVPAELNNFLLTDPLDFDLLNLDGEGYASDKTVTAYNVAAHKTRAKYVTINVQYGRILRNHGDFVDMMKRLMPKVEGEPDPDQVKASVQLAFFGTYDIIDDWEYTRDAREKCRPMRMMVLKKRETI
jgi:hypothetical protein